jgi:hypothetical protein
MAAGEGALRATLGDDGADKIIKPVRNKFQPNTP